MMEWSFFFFVGSLCCIDPLQCTGNRIEAWSIINDVSVSYIRSETDIIQPNISHNNHHSQTLILAVWIGSVFMDSRGNGV